MLEKWKQFMKYDLPQNVCTLNTLLVGTSMTLNDTAQYTEIGINETKKVKTLRK